MNGEFMKNRLRFLILASAMLAVTSPAPATGEPPQEQVCSVLKSKIEQRAAKAPGKYPVQIDPGTFRTGPSAKMVEGDCRYEEHLKLDSAAMVHYFQERLVNEKGLSPKQATREAAKRVRFLAVSGRGQEVLAKTLRQKFFALGIGDMLRQMSEAGLREMALVYRWDGALTNESTPMTVHLLENGRMVTN